jgi:DNA (cytosine-5)-methyltransferase 1
LAQGFPKDWTLPDSSELAESDRVDSLRYHAVGNSVTPAVAKWVASRLAKVLADHDEQMAYQVAAE